MTAFQVLPPARAGGGAAGASRRRRRSSAFDAVVALLALLQSAPYVLDPHDLPQWALLLIAVALSAPLVLRRRWPLPVFASLFGVAAVVAWWAPQSVFVVSLLIALYTVVAHGLRLVGMGCAAALIGATAVWSLRLYTDWQSVAVLLAVLVVATTVFGLYVAARRALLAELRERARRLEFERDQQAVIAAAAERARIAREMHDIVAHHLTVMVALADGAAAQSGRAPGRAADAMAAVAVTGREALADTRRLLGVLRDTTGDGVGTRAPLPTLADLDDLVAGVRAAGLAVRLEIDGSPPVLDPVAQLALFRLVQESLTNTLRHAGAASASVRIAYRPDEVRVSVLDDGTADRAAAVGRTAGGGPAASGRGLVGMRERLAAVGGQVEFGPAPPCGWAVRARLPVDVR